MFGVKLKVPVQYVSLLWLFNMTDIFLINQLWWLILYVSLTRQWGAQISDHRLFWLREDVFGWD